MQLREFFDYKNKLMEDLLTNPRIIDLIDADMVFDDPYDLAYKQIFPLEYTPNTVEHGKTFICFDVDVQEASADKTFYCPIIHIWVFTHRSKIRLPEGGVRVDELCSEICDTINGSREYGLGNLELYSAKRFTPMTDFPGKVLTFHAKDFNTLSNNRRYVPSNRKSG